MKNFERSARAGMYLNGVVPSSDQKMCAELLASQVNGVTQVVNNLQVQP